MASIPGSIMEVALYRCYDAFDNVGGHSGKSRCGVACQGIEHALRVSPERHQHPIACVTGNRDNVDSCPAAEPCRQSFDVRKDPTIQVSDLRKVVLHEPHRATDLRITREKHNRTTRNTPQLSNPLLLVCLDRKSTRLNSSHRCISYAVFCLKKKT